jgi:hypothetical protein
MDANTGTPARCTSEGWRPMSSPEAGTSPVDIDEAARQLELAIHDARVAFDCIQLGDLDRAHTNVITARTAADAAENLLRAALGGDTHQRGYA